MENQKENTSQTASPTPAETSQQVTPTAPQSIEPKTFSPRKTWVVVGIILLVLILVASLGEVYFLNQKLAEKSALTATCPTLLVCNGPMLPAGCKFIPAQNPCECPTKYTCPSPIPAPTANSNSSRTNWKTYTDNLLGYKIKYPPTWKISYFNDTKTLNSSIPVDVLHLEDPTNNYIVYVSGNEQVGGSGCLVDNLSKSCQETVITSTTPTGLTVYKEHYKIEPVDDPSIIDKYTFILNNPNKNYIGISSTDNKNPTLLQIVNTLEKI